MTDLTALWRFNRPKLTKLLAERALRGERIALFGPRQTGKTSLLREEVMPFLENQGALPIYIECWADKTDSLGSINYALQKALDNLLVEPEGLKRKLKTPVKKIGAAGVSLEFGEHPSRTLPNSKYLQVDALLTALRDTTKKPMVLIFDEFQAVATGNDADAATASLRAALTQAKRVGVIFSGSSEVLLLEAFSRSKAPLYGFANPEPYPLLGADFVAHVAKQFKKATGREFDAEPAFQLLAELGHQPEPFLNAVANSLATPRWSIEDGLRAMLDPKLRNKWTINWFGLTDWQRMAMRVVFEGKAPTSAQTLREIAAAMGEQKVQGSSVIRAVEALVNKGLVEVRIVGDAKRYVVSDPVMVAWLGRNKALPVRASER